MDFLGCPAPHIKKVDTVNHADGCYTVLFVCGHSRLVRTSTACVGFAPVCDSYGCTGEPKAAVKYAAADAVAAIERLRKSVASDYSLQVAQGAWNDETGAAAFTLAGLTTMQMAILKDWWAKLRTTLKESERPPEVHFRADPPVEWMPRQNYIVYDPAKETAKQAQERGIALDALDLLRRFITGGGK